MGKFFHRLDWNTTGADGVPGRLGNSDHNGLITPNPGRELELRAEYVLVLLGKRAICDRWRKADRPNFL